MENEFDPRVAFALNIGRTAPVASVGCPVEFLVRVDIHLPLEMTADERGSLYDAEALQAAILAEQGRLVRVWRIPGRRSNWGLWRADDATTLHESLSSLPLWKFMDVEVTALARHPNDPGTPE